MTDPERDFSPADREWMGGPNDILQRALEVIATTRHEWVSRRAVHGSVEDRSLFADPLFRLALDAVSSRAGRTRGNRLRSKRRASGQFSP
jgi:hypothetical protein